MDQSLGVTNIKKEPTESTSSNRLEISFEIQLNSVKQESDCLVYSGIDTKTEPQEVEMNKPNVKIEYEDLENEIMQDPLDVGSEIKDEERFPNDMDQAESAIKTESIKEQKDEYLLETNNDNSQKSGLNQGQEKLLITNNPVCRNKKYVCHVCNKIFTYKHVLNNHLRIHTGEKPFTCEFCEKSFKQKGHLDKHILIHSGEKPQVCDVCKKVFNKKSFFNLHMLIHNGKKPFSCTECNESFAYKHVLEKHKRIHTGEKPFACEICDKSFARNSHLTQHKRLHTGEKPYSCNFCNKSFAQKAGLNYHNQIHKH